jgi:hypothetical protein
MDTVITLTAIQAGSPIRDSLNPGLSWNNISNGIGTSFVSTPEVAIQTGTGVNQWIKLSRSIFSFDISSIVASRIIVAKLRLWCNSKFDTFVSSNTLMLQPYAALPADPTLISDTDYQAITRPALASGIIYGNWVVGAYNDFTIGANELPIIDHYITIGLRDTAYDISSVEPQWESNKLIAVLIDGVTDAHPPILEVDVVVIAQPTVTTEIATGVH